MSVSVCLVWCRNVYLFVCDAEAHEHVCGEWFCFVLFFEIGFLCIALAVLELAL